MSGDFRSWHEPDLPLCPQFGRYRGEKRTSGGNPILAVNDPEPTWVAEQWRAAETRRLLSAASYDTI